MSLTEPDAEEPTLFERVGGHPTFVTLTDEFFNAVRADPLLDGMYPADRAGAKERLLMFLEEYWGGPRHYSATRGQPFLRMRHMPYRINTASRTAWLDAMDRALSAVELSPEDEFLLRDYMDRAARYLTNADD